MPLSFFIGFGRERISSSDPISAAVDPAGEQAFDAGITQRRQFSSGKF
jgi:hypothetical protein